MEDKKWDVARIREEIAKLDELTGLKGAEVPITLGRGEQRIGCFCIDLQTQGPKKFIFSRFFYQDPNWPVAEKIETIRHEYAHFMDWVIFGNMDHGKTWENCCRRIGARTERRYRREFAENARKKEQQELELQKRCSEYFPGMIVIHPTFGTGCVMDVCGEGLERKAHVEFSEAGMKYLSVVWINENCDKG